MRASQEGFRIKWQRVSPTYPKNKKVSTKVCPAPLPPPSIIRAEMWLFSYFPLLNLAIISNSDFDFLQFKNLDGS